VAERFGHAFFCARFAGVRNTGRGAAPMFQAKCKLLAKYRQRWLERMWREKIVQLTTNPPRKRAA
jgi:hypothetical protein